MTHYVPELGQTMFGQPYKRYPCPEYIVALLDSLGGHLCRLMWNANQKEFPSPFENTGGVFKNDTFEANAYSWNDEKQSFNFKWEDVEVSWYKHLGRGTTINQKITPKKAIGMYNKCLGSLHRMDEDHLMDL